MLLTHTKKHGTGILPVTENTPTATPEVVSSPLSLVTSTALPSATLNSELITQNSPIPSVPTVTSVVNIPTATVIPTNTAELLPTIPPDPYATQAMSLLTPVPTDTPVALQTAPPDPYATQAAQMADSSTPAPQPTVAQAQTPQVITSPTPLATPVQALAATSQPNLERYYYHANRLYNVCALTNAQGNVVERYQYNAYGLCTTFDANYELPLTFSRFGNPYTFTGRELDAETDLMDYRWRTYSPRQGRFEQTDPIGYLGGNNLYQYVDCLPTDSIDPFGTDPTPTPVPTPMPAPTPEPVPTLEPVYPEPDYSDPNSLSRTSSNVLTRAQFDPLLMKLYGFSNINVRQSQLNKGCVGITVVAQGQTVPGGVVPETYGDTKCYLTEEEARARTCCPPKKPVTFAKQGTFKGGKGNKPTPNPEDGGSIPPGSVEPNPDGTFNYVTIMNLGGMEWYVGANHGVIPGKGPMLVGLDVAPPLDNPSYPDTMWCTTCVKK